MADTRYSKALIRNINEVVAATLEWRAVVAFERAQSKHGWDFFRVAYNSLLNDMLAHIIRVLDRDEKSASFWYLHRCREKAIDDFVKQQKLDWSVIEEMARKLKDLRNKTHFHIDRRAVLDPPKVWREADIRGPQLARCLEVLELILQFLYTRDHDFPFDVPSYDGKDVKPIIDAARMAGVI